jgi:acid phosphatase type 7
MTRALPAVAMLLAALAGCGGDGAASKPPTVTVVATADASCSDDRPPTAETCRQQAVSDRALALDPDALIMAGDSCYDDSLPMEPTTATCLPEAYEPAWGRLKEETLPAAGNHECYVTEPEPCAAYFDYWGDQAGPRGRGYYTRRLGGWLVLVLNSNCSFAGGCEAGSPQETWLRRRLEDDEGRCELIVLHHPLFSSGRHGDNPAVEPLWKAAEDNRVELAVQGHDHHMERFLPITSAGVRDDDTGVRSFITGAGGKDHYELGDVKPESAFRDDVTFGVLRLTLTATGFSSAFIAEDGAVLDRSGPAACR